MAKNKQNGTKLRAKGKTALLKENRRNRRKPAAESHQKDGETEVVGVNKRAHQSRKRSRC